MVASALVLNKIECIDKTKYETLYLHSKAETIIDENEIDDNAFKSIYTTVISKLQKYLGNDSGWITDSVIGHNINISNYNPLAGNRYLKLLKEWDHPWKELINIQNIDDN